jgi:hypothetical protein
VIKEKGKRGRRSDASLAPSKWRSHIERTIRQQALELIQLHQPVVLHTYQLEAWAACEEAQRLAMMTWSQDSQGKGDAHHEDNKL